MINYRLDWYSSVPENICATAASVVADVVEAIEQKTGLLRDGILILLIPVDTPGAFAAHKSERVIPGDIRELADKHKLEYIIVLAAGLFEVEPVSAKAS